jgi:DNA-directed RNA polymerase specialized sigma24 family protein
VPEDDQHQGQCFPATRWTMVGRAGETDPATARKALGQLLQVYLPALRAHLVSIKRIDPTHAEDLLQSFISAKFLEANLAAEADRTKGKFRTLLLTALDRFVISEHRRASARKRGGCRSPAIDIDQIDVVASGEGSPSALFDVSWGRNLVGEAVRRMEAECRMSGRPDLWGVFDCRFLSPILDGTPPAEYDELVQRFGFKSPSQASNALITAKRMFHRVLHSIVAEYARSPQEVDDELRDLCAILSRAGAGAS